MENFYVRMAYDQEYFMDNYHKITFSQLLCIQRVLIFMSGI